MTQPQDDTPETGKAPDGGWNAQVARNVLARPYDERAEPSEARILAAAFQRQAGELADLERSLREAQQRAEDSEADSVRLVHEKMDMFDAKLKAEQQLAEAQKRIEGQAERILSLEHLHKQVNEHHFGVRELHVKENAALREQLAERTKELANAEAFDSDEVQSLRAERDALAADAQRLRELLSRASTPVWVCMQNTQSVADHHELKALEAEIDAALEQKS